MTEAQRIWSDGKRRLTDAVTSLGYPEDLSDLLAKELKSPKAIDRMTSYLYHVRPHSMEMIVDEMLAISAAVDSWREKKEAEDAQAGISAWYSSKAREQLYREENED